ncbi:MAG TPA: DUF6152 family protein [Bryobacteraceae bacterium]|nr:DUF6152 family protein [Bryobacteraceae bacterium]
MRDRLFTLVALGMFLAGAPAFSHHAFSGEFDASKPITLEGVVTRIDWENPHVYFYVDVTQPDGTVLNWKCETRGPKGLESRGWKRDSLKLGDKVIVKGSLARNGSRFADGRQVTLVDGRKILTGLNN